MRAGANQNIDVGGAFCPNLYTTVNRSGEPGSPQLAWTPVPSAGLRDFAPNNVNAPLAVIALEDGRLQLFASVNGSPYNSENPEYSLYSCVQNGGDWNSPFTPWVEFGLTGLPAPDQEELQGSVVPIAVRLPKGQSQLWITSFFPLFTSVRGSGSEDLNDPTSNWGSFANWPEYVDFPPYLRPPKGINDGKDRAYIFFCNQDGL